MHRPRGPAHGARLAERLERVLSAIACNLGSGRSCGPSLYRRPAGRAVAPRAAVRRLHDRIGDSQATPEHPLMDVEHINAIGNALADLTRRTQGLRGYL